MTEHKDEAMTLEEVRDALRHCHDHPAGRLHDTVHIGCFANWADALDAAIAARDAKVEVTDAMVEIGCRGICSHYGWDADEPVIYSGTRTKARNRDGSYCPQWQMHATDVRAALEAALAKENGNGNG